MKKRLLIICFVFLGLNGIQVMNAQDIKQLKDVDRAYSFIPDSLSPERYLKRLESVEKQVDEFMSGLENDERKLVSMMRFNGILWSLGTYIHKHESASLKSVLEQKLEGLDLDSQDVELLPDNEIMNLINAYLDYYYPRLSEIQRATYVLYNIKSEKVRNVYVLSVLMKTLKRGGVYV